MSTRWFAPSPRLTTLLSAAAAALVLPVAASAAPIALDVDVNYTHACATTSCGDVLCWGCTSVR